MEKLIKITLLIFYLCKFSIGQNKFNLECPAEEDPDNPVHLPHESDCGLFYKCGNGDLALFECPGELHWSVQLDRCEWPQIANCILSTVATTPAPRLDPRCPPNEDPNKPTHLPHEYDCTLFYKCDRGYAKLFYCPPEQHWSIALDRCDWPYIANCTLSGSSTSVPVTSTQPTTTTSMSTTISSTSTTTTSATSESTTITESTPAPRLDPRCPPNEDPNKPTHLPHEYDCTLFYKCDRGYAKLFYCPPEQHWSIALDRCDWPHVANCTLSGSSTSVPVTSTQPTTTTSMSTTISSTSTTTTSATSESTTTTESTPTPTRDPRCPSEDNPRAPVHLPHEYDCALFYKCDRGIPILQECPRGLHWSNEFNRCEWPHIANCTLDLPIPPTAPPCSGETTSNTPTSTLSTTTSLSESTITTETTTPGPRLDPRCPPNEDPNNPTHLPHEYDCTLFYKCDRGYAKLLNCPPEQHWSIALDRCEWPQIANCTLSGSSTSVPITSTQPTTTTSMSTTISSTSTTTTLSETTTVTGSTPTPKLDPRCPSENDPRNPTHLPHESDCTLFYKCDRGYAILQECPQYLHWSTEFDRCEWSHIANCTLGLPVPATAPPCSGENNNNIPTPPTAQTLPRCPSV